MPAAALLPASKVDSERLLIFIILEGVTQAQWATRRTHSHTVHTYVYEHFSTRASLYECMGGVGFLYLYVYCVFCAESHGFKFHLL